MRKNKGFVRIIGYKCEECGVRNNLTIHHRDGNKNNNVRSNLKLLCRSCHDKEDGINPPKPKVNKKYQPGTPWWKRK